MKLIAILLSTYNGEKFLKEQLDSIMEQSYQDFMLYIRDDGSSDNTVSIIKEYKQNYPKQITFIEDDKGNLGVRKSFEETMKKANANYYCFCDQDDYWEKNKLETFYNLFEKYDNKKVHLSFSTMKIMNDKQQIISTKKFSKANFKGHISGCTMFFNHAAKQKYFKINYKGNSLHDYHMLMTSLTTGHVEYINKALIKHYIHSSNYYGMIKKNKLHIEFLGLLKYIFKNKEYREIILKDYFDYVIEVLSFYDNSLRIKKGLLTNTELNNLPYFKRKKWYYKHFFSNSTNIFRELIKLILI